MFGRYTGIFEYLFAIWTIAVVLLLVGFQVASWWFGRKGKDDWMN